MGEFFIPPEQVQALLTMASEKTGIPRQTLEEKLSGFLKNGGVTVNDQIRALLSDPKKVEMLMRSGVAAKLIKDLGGKNEK